MRNERAVAKPMKSLKTYITPPIDMYETPDAYLIFIDIPGVKKEDLSIKVIDNTLLVQGKFDIPIDKGQDVIFSELEKGEYRREFILSGDVDRNKIEAKFENGVLKLTLAKKEEAKEIEIKIN